jgi:hypothetical protein
MKMRVIAVLLLASAALGQAPEAQAPAVPTPDAQMSGVTPDVRAPSTRPVGTMSELMVKVIYPTSDAIFYIPTRTPKDQGEWNDLQGKALMLAEAANLLMMPGRARDQSGWMTDAKLLLDVGTAAFKAAKNKDIDAMTALNDQLYMACVTCHADYRPNYKRRQ